MANKISAIEQYSINNIIASYLNMINNAHSNSTTTDRIVLPGGNIGTITMVIFSLRGLFGCWITISDHNVGSCEKTHGMSLSESHKWFESFRKRYM